MSHFSTCRYKLVELVGYVAMGAVPALVILSMVRTNHTLQSRSETSNTATGFLLLCRNRTGSKLEVLFISARHLKSQSDRWGYLTWGCVRYLSIAGVLPAEDEFCSQFGEADRKTGSRQEDETEHSTAENVL